MSEDLLAEARAEAKYEEIYARADAEAARRSELREHPEKIEVGEGITMRTSAGGLYAPYTVIEIKRNGRELVIQRDKTIIDGPNSWGDEAPRHYERDAKGRIEIVTKRKDGSYIVKGAPMEWYSTRYHIGYRREWTDYSQ